MAKATSAKQVIKAIGNEHLELVRGNGYWYFVYDNAEKHAYDTKSIYTMYLSHTPLEQWVADGREFVEHMEREFAQAEQRRAAR